MDTKGEVGKVTADVGLVQRTHMPVWYHGETAEYSHTHKHRHTHTENRQTHSHREREEGRDREREGEREEKIQRRKPTYLG